MNQRRRQFRAKGKTNKAVLRETGPVRCGCLCSVIWLAVISEGDLSGQFAGAADEVELDGAARCGLECVEQVVGVRTGAPWRYPGLVPWV
jgi:hypothetical protein